MGKLTLGAGAVPGDFTIYNLVKPVVKTLPFDVVIISWSRPGARVAGTGRISKHASGEALDLRPKMASIISNNSPCGGNTLDQVGSDQATQLAAALEKAGLAVVLWLTCEGGNHYDHVHTDNGGETKLLPDNEASSSDRPAWAVGPLGPIHDAADAISNVVGFFYNENGLVRIAEVALGFGALILGVVAVMMDQATRTPAGRAALTATGAGAVVSATRNPKGAAKKAARTVAANRQDKKLTRQHGEAYTNPKLYEVTGETPGQITVEDRPYEKKQTTKARVRNNMAAYRREAKERERATV